MNKTSFIADGQTKNFYFTFPFFLKSDVIITVNGQPATNYNLICTKNDLNADIPFIGGCVQFNKPPRATDVITIQRKLPLARNTDYQPTAPYNPTTLNQDLNYLIEILKDMQSGVDLLLSQPSEATNKEQIDTLSQQIAQIMSSLADINTRIDQMDTSGGDTVDLTEINASIANLTTAVNTLNTQYGQLSNQVEELGDASLPENIDYVIAWQNPTAENNYTWYRKYASGWVEQGGLSSTGTEATGKKIIFPVPMSDASYTVVFGIPTSWNEQAIEYGVRGATKTSTEINVIGIQQQNQSTVRQNLTFTWLVCGIAA